ncbi:DUF2505 domain-containing protein [Cellulomonas shaoxiangyii]|uniref:DUF2505 domain-containing protein n=1 Tax=Cellulomonas shaoxiangyii TaxID=2566013 RepID=A0A4P7SHF1_9CELL|nr:DUF2505 domain-containing protein [Cellulomonas shaoxiangyii]QCB93111.1 DUF2505 domain-containing protein [Cellulomonas shaoxiangyii]TGY84859.1 DUF2505 domain-containing protein [Cellulomonas shaoxiangyii]
MRLHVTHELPADAADVGRMLADPAYVDAKMRASGAEERQVHVTGTPPGAFTVTTRRALPTQQIPANLAGVVGARIEVRQVEAWEAADADGGRTGTVVVEIVGAPVRVTGRTALTVAGAGASTLTYEGDVRAALPLFAAPVEEATAQAVRAALDAEAAAARSWLSPGRVEQAEPLGDGPAAGAPPA